MPTSGSKHTKTLCLSTFKPIYTCQHARSCLTIRNNNDILYIQMDLFELSDSGGFLCL